VPPTKTTNFQLTRPICYLLAMEKLSKGFFIENLWSGYWPTIIFVSLLIRFLFSFLRALEYNYDANPIHNDASSRRIRAFRSLSVLRRFDIIFRGGSKLVDPYPDLWYNTVLGTIELFWYPIFMKTESWAAIGAWMAFKAIAQWQVWTTNRRVFNRYAIINAIVIIAAYYLRDYIVPKG
jgi:hypothetical protein